MQEDEDLPYFEASALQGVELPYVGKQFSMVVVLPKNVEGLRAVEGMLTPGNLARWIGGARERKVDLFLPRFRVGGSFELPEMLQAMGLRLGFTDFADFSGMVPASREPLKLNRILHKTFVDVNEDGTEAAAETGVDVICFGAADKVVFRADHPFLFLIRDRPTGTILFIGRIADPCG